MVTAKIDETRLTKTNESGLPARLFVTGTDTGVGKTVVSAILTAGLEAAYWKPIESGVEEGSDARWIQETLSLDAEKVVHQKYRLTKPLSPHAAARIDGVRIDLDSIALPEPCPERLIVEGAGGILVPLNERDLIIDLIAKLALPVVIVARSALGTINHTLLTVTTLRSRGITVHGVVMNGERNASNKEAIEHYGNVPVIAEISQLPNPLDRHKLLEVFENEFSLVARKV